MDDICDEEKSYNDWVSKNIRYIGDHKTCIHIMKKLYMDGFAAGFIHCGKIKAEEQLQK